MSAVGNFKLLLVGFCGIMIGMCAAVRMSMRVFFTSRIIIAAVRCQGGRKYCEYKYLLHELNSWLTDKKNEKNNKTILYPVNQDNNEAMGGALNGRLWERNIVCNEESLSGG